MASFMQNPALMLVEAWGASPSANCNLVPHVKLQLKCRWNSPSQTRNDFELQQVSIGFAALPCPCNPVHQSNRTSLLRRQHHRTGNLTSVSVDQATLATGKCYSVLLLRFCKPIRLSGNNLKLHLIMQDLLPLGIETSIQASDLLVIDLQLTTSSIMLMMIWFPLYAI